MYKVNAEALEMVEIYQENLEDKALTADGWDKLSGYFGQVPELLRASVMNDFMKELTNRGIEYNTEVFQKRPDNVG